MRVAVCGGDSRAVPGRKEKSGPAGLVGGSLRGEILRALPGGMRSQALRACWRQSECWRAFGFGWRSAG